MGIELESTKVHGDAMFRAAQFRAAQFRTAQLRGLQLRGLQRRIVLASARPRVAESLFLAASLFVAAAPTAASAGSGEFTITVVDADTKATMPCRMHITNEKEKPQKVGRFPFWHDHFVFPGKMKLKLAKGTYNFVIERGPEYLDMSGYFIIDNQSKDQKQIELKRIVNLAEEGWWSVDLHVHRPLKDIELLMMAEDLHVAPVITWWNDKSEWSKHPPPDEPVKLFDTNRYYDLLGGEDEREGGALLYFRLDKPLDLAGAEREYPSPMAFLAQAREQPRAWVDAEKPFWWDLPVWLACGKIDSIGLCNNHMCRDEMKDNEAWGKPRDVKRLPPPLGNAKWSQEIYYHVLNCGFRIPPSAGSASGVLPNPVGYNRIYVWVDPRQFNYDTWWEGFKAGRVVVSNGPMMRPLANGRMPGHVFKADEGDSISLDVVLTYTFREPITYFELIKNGRVAQSVRYEELAKTGHFPPLSFDESGWFLVRAVTDIENTYRFASSGPWYVEIGENKQPVVKRSAKFFLDWAKERAGRVKLDDADQRREVLRFHEEAIKFWEERVEQAEDDE